MIRRKDPPALRALLNAHLWRRVEPVPCAPLRRPLRECRLALVTSAGLTPPGEPPFDDDDRRGDGSYRIIPTDTDVQQLEAHQRTEWCDYSGIERDSNLAFPLHRLRELRTRGVVGTVAPRHLSFVGSINAPDTLIRTTAPRAARLLVEDRVDVALLVPI